jgi:DNA polymerase-4/DNA polymerase V
MSLCTTPSSYQNRVIAHIDADAFFASCEQAVNPTLKQAPVVIGRERGIATAMSYQAKSAGVMRGMTMSQVRTVCPDAIILPGNFERYQLFSSRMHDIFARFTNRVEKNGVDEAFLDLTEELDSDNPKSAILLAQQISQTITNELGITVSIGIAPTKSLAKIASARHKPHGLTQIHPHEIYSYLHTVGIEQVWGIGRNTAEYLREEGIARAYDFAKMPETWVRSNMSKPHILLHQELQGTLMYQVAHVDNLASPQRSIEKTRTLHQPTDNPNILYAHLLNNLERACRKARKQGQYARSFGIMLKEHGSFRRVSLRVPLKQATAFPMDLHAQAHTLFTQLYQSGITYRSTGVYLCELQSDLAMQPTLFEGVAAHEVRTRVYQAMDQIEQTFGKGIVTHATTLRTKKELHAQAAQEQIPQHKRLDKLKKSFRLPIYQYAVR